MSPDIITQDITPLTAGERLRIYLERREAALASGHGSSCELVAARPEPVAAQPSSISLFLRGAA